MTELSLSELRRLFDWIAANLSKIHGDVIEIDHNFYRRPGSTSWFFDYECNHDTDEQFGSFEDEIDLLRKSVLSGEDDILDVVAERVAYLLLLMTHKVEQERRTEAN